MPLSMGYLETLCNTLVKRVQSLGFRIDESPTVAHLKILEQQFEEVPIIQQKFPTFHDFLNEVLAWSYNLKIDREKNSTSLFLKEVPPDEHQFSQKVDLFKLIAYLVKEYPQKYQQYNFTTRRKLDSTNEITLTAGFAESFWDNIFNDYDRYRGEDGKEICLFNHGQHALGSYLHSAHPSIHYLHVTSSGHDQPISTAILMECTGGNQENSKEPYLIVEGVLSDFGNLQPQQEQIYSFLWDSIKKFAFQRRKNIFVNGCHSGNQREPEDFTQYVGKLEKVSLPLHPLGQKKGKDGHRIAFTHQFEFPADLALKQQVSIKTKKSSLYNLEQYADTFYLTNKGEFPKKEHFNSFFELGGYAQGFEVCCPKPKKLLYKTITAGVLASLLIGGYFAIRQQPSICEKATLKNGIISCNENSQEKKISFVDLDHPKAQEVDSLFILQANIYGNAYQFVVGKENKIAFKSALRIKEEVEKLIAKRDPNQCRKEKLTNPESSIPFLVDCLGNKEAVFRILDLSRQYILAGANPGEIHLKIARKAWELRNSRTILNMIDAFTDENIILAIKKIQTTPPSQIIKKGDHIALMKKDDLEQTVSQPVTDFLLNAVLTNNEQVVAQAQNLVAYYGNHLYDYYHNLTLFHFLDNACETFNNNQLYLDYLKAANAVREQGEIYPLFRLLTGFAVEYRKKNEVLPTDKFAFFFQGLQHSSETYNLIYPIIEYWMDDFQKSGETETTLNALALLVQTMRHPCVQERLKICHTLENCLPYIKEIAKKSWEVHYASELQQQDFPFKKGLCP